MSGQLKVKFHSAIDYYNPAHFPSDFCAVPSIDHKVKVSKSVRDHFVSRKLPTELIVVGVTWDKEDSGGGSTVANVELHYSATDIKLAELNNVKLYG